MLGTGALSPASQIHTVKHVNRQSIAKELPVIAVTNARSLLPHINNLMEDISENHIDLTIVCEVWETEVQPKLNSTLEYFLNMKGLQFISCGARKNKRRGGGVGIILNNAKFTAKKLDIIVPGVLEVVWILVRPKKVTLENTFREIITAGFYSPPGKGKNNALLDHLTTTANSLLSKYPKAGLILGGDKNGMNVSPLITSLPRTLQIVTKNTHNDKILDIVLTNLHQYYAVPVVLSPVKPDNPSTHKDSDHKYAVAVPLDKSISKCTREYTIRSVRPTPDTARKQFGAWLLSEEWELVFKATNPTDKVTEMRTLFIKQVNKYFPIKIYKISNQDLPYITKELKKLDRHKKREHKRHGKSEKFKSMKAEFERKLKIEATRYINKNVSEAKITNPARANKILKQLAEAPGDRSEHETFTLLKHIEEGLGEEDQRNQILKYFSKVSQEFLPLQRLQLPENIQNEMNKHIKRDHLPFIDNFTMWQALRVMKKTNSEVPDELPASLRTEFLQWLSEPASDILNSIITTQKWPEQWKNEFGTPIPKNTLHPATEEDLRIISITARISMQCEIFVAKWIWENGLKNHMDRDQFGGLPGNSIAHYLIEVTNFILFNQDLSKPIQTIMLLVDFSKGFNRIDHNTIIKELFSIGIPGWLLNIVASYLENRKLLIRYKGQTSQQTLLPGGVGQGTILGLWLFLVMMNTYGKPHEEKTLGEYITAPFSKRIAIKETKAKWVDDLTKVKGVDIKRDTEKANEEMLTRPLPGHARTEHKIKKHMNTMHEGVSSIFRNAEAYHMKVNCSKTKIMLFNAAKKDRL